MRAVAHGQSYPWETVATPSQGQPRVVEAQHEIKKGSEGHKEVKGGWPQPHKLRRDPLFTDKLYPTLLKASVRTGGLGVIGGISSMCTAAIRGCGK